MHRKDLLYNSKMDNNSLLNKQILNLKNQVDSYISYKLQYQFPKVFQKECKEYIKKGKFTDIEEIYTPRASRNFFDYFQEFYEYKSIELRKKPSLKDYKSLENALRDFETLNRTKLNFNLTNSLDFFNRFRNFLSEPHPKQLITKGGLNNNTVWKRISSLKTFLQYIQNKKYYRFEDAIFKYKIKKFQTDFVTLNRDEIRQLENLKITNRNWQKIIDVFVCNCFMSLRYSDLLTLEKGEFLQDEDGDYYYRKKSEKTEAVIEIPILPTSLAILKKYNFTLPIYTNQYFNRELKNILKHYDLFPEIIKKSEIKNGQTVTAIYIKRELISSHTCRRSYITNAISNNVSLNAIQSSTGHSQLSTLSRYVKKNRNKEQLKSID